MYCLANEVKQEVESKAKQLTEQNRLEILSENYQNKNQIDANDVNKVRVSRSSFE